MTERALTEDALLAGLRDIHLPAEGAGGTIAELAAAGAFACALALLFAALLRALSLRRRSVAAPSLRARIEASRALPEAERRVALLHLLKERDPTRFHALKQGLYRADSTLDADTVAAELARHA